MKRRAMVMVAALALAGGACGGDDDGDVTDGTAATADEADDAGDVTDVTDVTEDNDATAATADEADDADDSGDDTAVTEDTDADVDDDTVDDIVTDVGLVRDELVRQLILAGMTDDQATCMADNLDMEEVATNGANDLTMFIDLFEKCGIDASKLAPPP